MRLKNKKINSKNSSYIFSKKAFLIIQETELAYIFLKKVFLIFQEIELSIPKNKYFRKEFSKLAK